MSKQDQPNKNSSAILSRRMALRTAIALPIIGSASAQNAEAAEGWRQPWARTSYNTTVLDDRPSAFWAMDHPKSGVEMDASGHGHIGKYVGHPRAATLPNGDTATAFNGSSQYMQVKDHSALSPATTGVFTIEAWMRPDTLRFPHREGTGYVHWMGKGEPNNHEYASRMYSTGNTEERANRISGYLFNAVGGKGAGSYFQKEVPAGEWIHYVFVINANVSLGYPNGYTKIYRNGSLEKQDHLVYRGTRIIPHRGNAPFRVGTRDFNSFFKGAIGKVAVYGKELPGERIHLHYAVMTKK
ncbi:LamG domain-containing protein [Arthrobacter sp. K5]|uniref:LamG domain-containing protein n=1 Tax=Arthrobacter sp. K5 TaxID=2839623 RepID=A0AAU8ESB3_9MICC